MKVVSLELAKQLKKVGYPQKAHFIYVLESDNKTVYLWEDSSIITKENRIIIASPTADEILEKLPPMLQFKKKVEKNPDWRIEFIPEDELKELKHTGFLTINNPNRWVVNYMSNACFGNQNMAEVFYDDTNLANAAAKCWLYLKKNNYLKRYEI